jgi:hypothetical protein
MEPSMVWLIFIPVFNFIWQFIIVSKLSESIAEQYRNTGNDTPEFRPTYGVGMIASTTWALSFAISILNSNLTILKIIQGILSMAAFISWIVYWIKVANYKKRLQALPQTTSTL